MGNGVGAFSPARLVGARRGRNLTQKTLGKAVGRTSNTMRGYENGDRVPPEEIESALCEVLGIGADGLRARYDDELGDYHDAARITAGEGYDAASVTALLPGRSRRTRKTYTPRPDDPESVAARLREAIAQLTSEQLETIEKMPPLTASQRATIALAFGAAHSETGGDAA